MRTHLTRRAILRTASLAAGAALGELTATAGEAPPQVKLRLLETSDLHMFVLDWDYYHVKPDPTVGFAKVATLIRAARAESVNTLLFDNGDFLQGSPLADYIAQEHSVAVASPHPIVGIMGSLNYDAAGLGNHEFNYGLDFLEASLAHAAMPFVCANITRVGGGVFLAPYAVLERKVKDATGAEQTLRIGVIGFVPPQIMNWDKSRLTGKIETSGIVAAARRYVPELRERCDVLVALSHSGINAGPASELEENASFHLAAVPGIDVIMTGHSHRVFPGADYAGLDGVDAVNGRLNGVPAVMPGFWGSHLGVVDLTLTRHGARWAVDKAEVETRPIYRRDHGKVQELTTRDAAVAAAITSAHQGTLAWVEQPVGSVESSVHSYLAWSGYDPASALVNAAQAWYVKPLLIGTPGEKLPLLASVAAFRVGYTPDSFIDIAKGSVALRQVADLYQYTSNTVVAVKVTGAQIIEWLEFSARIFNTIDPGAAGPQALIDRHFPSYNFDIIGGLSYQFDVTRPPRYDAHGALDAKLHRVVDVRFEGQPIDPNREFVVITNNYRADGGGNFPGMTGANVILRAPDTNRDAILNYFRSAGAVTVPRVYPWSFAAPGRPVQVYFDSGKPAAGHLGEVAGLKLLGEGEPGYARIGMTLA